MDSNSPDLSSAPVAPPASLPEDLLVPPSGKKEWGKGVEAPSREATLQPEAIEVPLGLPVEVRTLPRFEKPLQVSVREARLLTQAPWVRPLGKLTMEVSTHGWRFPAPLELLKPAKPHLYEPPEEEKLGDTPAPPRPRTRLRPPNDAVLFKDRLLYLLQPPLEDIFAGKQVQLPFAPYPYQMQGIAFLMPRHAALLADEMGLGKTMQAIVALRLMFHSGLIQRVLVVCPKPLVINWTRKLRTWAEDVPFEVVGGDLRARKACWFASKCPLKLVNYELLTRDAPLIHDERVQFDVVILDEAQRIKNRESKTAQVVRTLQRDRSWAMTGTPIENRTEDLVNIFTFLDPDRIPPETPGATCRATPAIASCAASRRTWLRTYHRRSFAMPIWS